MSKVGRTLLYIRWHDAAGASADWQHLEDLDDRPLKDYIINSVGFVLRETETVIHIAPHIHEGYEQDQYCGDMQIPKSAIIEQWEIVDTITKRRIRQAVKKVLRDPLNSKKEKVKCSEALSQRRK